MPNLDIINTLVDLLEQENLQVRTFVNGTLYSLLSRNVLRQQAMEIGLSDLLTHLIDHSDERFAKQLSYLKTQLEKEDEDEIDTSDVDIQVETDIQKKKKNFSLN